MISLSRFFLTFLLGIILPLFLIGQKDIIAFGLEWDTQLDEWYLIDENENEGLLETKWKLREDRSEWTYDIGEQSGVIRRKWPNMPFRWELRSHEGIIVEFDIKWRNDLSEWELKSGDFRIKYYMPDQYDPGFWVMDDRKYGYIECLSAREGDPRDWEVYYELNEALSFEIKLAMCFISIATNVFYR